MALTIAPSEEACQAIVDRINAGSGGVYTLSAAATFAYQTTAKHETAGLFVEVIHESEETLNDTLDGGEARTSHVIKVWLRAKPADDAAAITAAKLVLRQIFQRLDNYDTANKRVRVWECDNEQAEVDRSVLNENGMFSEALTLRVEVEAS